MMENNLYIITWKIENFSKFGDLVPYLSPVCKTGDSEENWHIELHPHGDDLNPNYLSCYLKRSAGIGELNVTYTFDFIDSVGKTLIFENGTKTFKENDSERCNLILVERLRNEIKKWTVDILTIRCLIATETQNKMPTNVHFNFYSKMFVHHNTFKWLVEEPDTSEYYQEQVFNCDEDKEFEVILTDSKDDIIIEIYNIKSNLCATIKMYLMNADQLVQAYSSIIYVKERKNSNLKWKFPTFFTKETLREKNCIKDGYFCLIIEFITPNEIAIDEIENNISQNNTVQFSDSFVALSTDFEKILSDQKHSDVTLNVEGLSFNAHKCILSSRSPVFCAMFDCDSLEDKTGVVNINDIDSVTLKNLLKYLYTGTIDSNTCENTLKLIIAADKYQVEMLIEKCAYILMTLMSLENVYDIIVIADMLDNKILKSSALSLIEKHTETFLSSPKWHELLKTNNKLGIEILSSFALHVVKKIKYE